MRYLYIRADKIMSEQEQADAFIRVGFSPSADTNLVRENRDQTALARMISILEAFDEVVVVSGSRLGKDAHAAVAACSDILHRGAFLRILRGELKLHPQMLPAVQAISSIEAEYEDIRRKLGSIHGGKGGRPGMSPEELAQAKRIWMDPSYTLKEAIEKTGRSKSNLYRLFGARPG